MSGASSPADQTNMSHGESDDACLLGDLRPYFITNVSVLEDPESV